MTTAVFISPPWAMRHDVRRQIRIREVRVADDRFEWQRIADLIRRRIADGDYPVGSLIPTVRQLMASEGRSDNTVSRALSALADEGLIRPAVGVGTRVIATPADAPKTADERIAELEEQLAEHEERLRRLESPED